MYLAINQYGDKVILEGKYPRKALLDYYNASNAEKMYVDTKSGETKHIGYIVQGMWFKIFNVSEWKGKA